MYSNYRIAATLFCRDTVYLRYITVNTLHKGDDIDDDDFCEFRGIITLKSTDINNTQSTRTGNLKTNTNLKFVIPFGYSSFRVT
jgi:hypothetical protein